MTIEHDLRTARAWERWRGILHYTDRQLVSQAAMEYVDAEDTIVLLYPHNAHRALGEEGFSRVVDLIRAHYDANRARWMAEHEGTPMATRLPADAIMPRILIEVAPPSQCNH